jgi:hypothetical protein
LTWAWRQTAEWFRFLFDWNWSALPKRIYCTFVQRTYVYSFIHTYICVYFNTYITRCMYLHLHPRVFIRTNLLQAKTANEREGEKEKKNDE